jgi:hypothetical protein
MKLKVWMGIALVASLLVAATGTMLVAENDPALPLGQQNNLAANDPADPLTIVKAG